MPKGKVLIVDDEPRLRELYARILQLEGYQVHTAERAEIAQKALERDDFHVCLLDVRLPDANGVELTAVWRKIYPLTEIILVTAYGTIKDGVRAIQNGAANYLTKGDSDDQIIALVHSAMERAQLQRKVNFLSSQTQLKRFEDFQSSSKAFLVALEQASKVAPTAVSVLVSGETGSGKEWFAQAIHQASPYANGNFVAINCAAIPREMLESELFGHQKGSFTGAVTSKRGLVAEAEGGTLFLDEVGELPLELQAKLLRLLETGEYYALGDPQPRNANFRLISATHRNLQERVTQGQFREDLYFRVAVFHIQIPPLRERAEDIPIIAQQLFETHAPKINPRIRKISTEALLLVKKHAWPGNIRELRNAIERALIMAEGFELKSSDFQIENHVRTESNSSKEELNLVALEKKTILRVLEVTQNNRTKTAEILGISVSTLYRKLDEYGLS